MDLSPITLLLPILIFNYFSGNTGISDYTANTIFNSREKTGSTFDTEVNVCPPDHTFSACYSGCVKTIECSPGASSIIAGGEDNVIYGSSPNSGIFAGNTGFIESSREGALIGGCSNYLDESNRSVIIGGQNITGFSEDTAYVPNLNINYEPDNDNTLTQVLIRDESTGTVKYRDASSIGGSFSGNTPATCIDTLWVTTISGCSPVTIGSSIQSQGSIASGLNSFAYGDEVSATGNESQALGKDTVASGSSSHAQGEDTVAGGDHSHAEGKGSKSFGDQSHAEGNLTTASEDSSHAEGEITIASGTSAHAEGSLTIAGGYGSHAGGRGRTTGQEILSIGEGSFAHFTIEEATTGTTALGAQQDYSAILGGRDNDITSGGNDSVIIGGQWNLIDTSSSDYNSIVGGLMNQITSAAGEAAKYCSIVGGRNNLVGGAGGGLGNNLGIFNSFGSQIVGRNIRYSTIVGGNGHNIGVGSSGNDGNFIGGGTENEIGATDYSAIIGGDGHVISNNADRTIILGGSNITATAADTVYVPNLDLCEFGGILYTDTISGCSPVSIGEDVNIGGVLTLLDSIGNDDTIDEILVRDADGTVKYRDANSISGCCSTAGSPTPEGWFDTVNFDQANGGDLDADDITADTIDAETGRFEYIESSSPLLINDADQGKVCIGSTSGFTYDPITENLSILGDVLVLGGGVVQTETLKVTDGASENYVMVSNASGECTWGDPENLKGITNVINVATHNLVMELNPMSTTLDRYFLLDADNIWYGALRPMGECSTLILTTGGGTDDASCRRL